MAGSETEGDSDLERISGSEPLPAVREQFVARAPGAWEPVTPGGVAAFGGCGFGRLWLVSGLTAFLSAVVVAWAMSWVWGPVVEGAIRGLPSTGYIEHGELTTPRTVPEPLATSRFLGIGVDLDGRANANVGSDLYVKFQRREVLFCSVLGYLEAAYPTGYTIQFNRSELEPWWGAWKPMILAICLLGVSVLLLGVWWFLGLIYGSICWVVARTRGRSLGLGAAWRVGVAMNLSGALGLTLFVLGYALGVLPLVVLLAGLVLHFVPAWVYLFLCPSRLPQVPSARPRVANPFDQPRERSKASTGRRSGNVFRPQG